VVAWLTKYGGKQKRKGTPDMVPFPADGSPEVTTARRKAIERHLPNFLRLAISPNQLMKWGLMTETVSA
jgi:hypothetical protein